MVKKDSFGSLFSVNSTSGDSVIKVGPDGYCVIDKLALLDEKSGKKWVIKISDGELIIEPVDVDEKRDFRIGKLLD